MVKLKYKTQSGSPAHGQFRIAEPLHLLVLQAVTARGHALEQTHDIEQGAFAGAGWPDQRHELTAIHPQRQAMQHFSFARQTRVIGFANVAQFDQRVRSLGRIHGIRSG